MAGEDGALLIQNIGGVRSDDHSFNPDLKLKDPMDYGLVGLFHTHPYDEGYTGISLSGQDAGHLINVEASFSLVQSGGAQFLMLRTRASPRHADPPFQNSLQNVRMAQLEASGMSFSAASSMAARETAKRLGLAYYEGSHGTLKRIYP